MERRESSETDHRQICEQKRGVVIATDGPRWGGDRERETGLVMDRQTDGGWGGGKREREEGQR